MSSPAPAPNRAVRRASAKSNGHKYMSLSDWAHPTLIRVSFVGWDDPVYYELPDLMYEVASGLIPNDFLPAAERALGLDGNAGEPMPREERLDYIRMQAHVIAAHLRKPNPVEELGSLEAATEWVLKEMPVPHRNHLWALSVNHQVSSEDAAATFRLGVPSEEIGDDGGTAEDAAE